MKKLLKKFKLWLFGTELLTSTKWCYAHYEKLPCTACEVSRWKQRN